MWLMEIIGRLIVLLLPRYGVRLLTTAKTTEDASDCDRGANLVNASLGTRFRMPFLIRFRNPQKIECVAPGETIYTFVNRETTDDR